MTAPSFEICPISEDSLPEVAEYLSTRQTQNSTPASNGVALRNSAARILSRLQWRLMNNPARRADLDFGLCIRSSSGAVVGTHISYPGRFVHGDKQFLGLCGANFFVDPVARMQGFFMLRQFLNSKGVDFFFATTCNRMAGALWSKLGAVAEMGSTIEFILPVHYGPVLEELALRKKLGRSLTLTAKSAGTVISPFLTFLTLKRQRSALKVQPCADWDRLAALANRHRNPDVLTCERSAEYLQWRYAQTPSHFSKEIFHFADQNGNEGWFAVGEKRRGERMNIRAWTLLDVVWPRTRFDLTSIIYTIIESCEHRADIIVFKGRKDHNRELAALGFRQREFKDPLIYVKGTREFGQPLAKIADFVPADGDTID